MQDELLTIAQLARRLKVSRSWLKHEAEAGRVPALPASGGKFLFSRVAVEQALIRLAQGATS